MIEVLKILGSGDLIKSEALSIPQEIEGVYLNDREWLITLKRYTSYTFFYLIDENKWQFRNTRGTTTSRLEAKTVELFKRMDTQTVRDMKLTQLIS